MKNMTQKLTQPQRIIVATIYLVIVFICVSLLGGNLKELITGATDESIWFYSGILLIIMGQYVTEPFFSTPADSLSNAIATILALLSIQNRQGLYGYWFIFGFSLILIVLSISAMATKDMNNKFSTIVYILANKLGSSKFLFSVIYLFSAYSYFFKTNKINYLIVSIALWICIMFFRIAENMVSFICRLFKTFTQKEQIEYIGDVIKSTNSLLCTVEIKKGNPNINKIQTGQFVAIENIDGNFEIGVIINLSKHIDSLWIDIVLLSEENKIISVEKSNFSFIKKSTNNNAFILDEKILNKLLSDSLKNNDILLNQKNFVGFIMPESDINLINFSIITNAIKIKEGTIVKVLIKNTFVLYQIVNGLTKEVCEEKGNNYGYICAKARKLGVYSYEDNQLNIVPWVPNINEKVYLIDENENVDLKEIANTAIGRLPNSDMKIRISDINKLVTHNAAVLGILGVGKSCLTFELINKIVNQSDCKIICIDITNQYYTEKGLFAYIDENFIANDFEEKHIETIRKESEKTGSPSKPSEWGNVEVYKKAIKWLIKNFFESDKKVLVLNPDFHTVKKAASNFNIQELLELTAVEKTRIISEEILKYCMEQGQVDSARCCVVLEEAHSLVPEWNSVSSPGDQNATNGTAKVILQGRKYGLGCILVTQRTANVTKSILNQCNSIFAMRVYDDTGKSFLENYIGSDYSSTLPTLEERHAIVTGKALGLKQPVVIQLNDKKYFKQ